MGGAVKEKTGREAVLKELMNAISKANGMYEGLFDKSGLVSERLTRAFMADYWKAVDLVKGKFGEYIKACEKERFSPEPAMEDKYNDVLFQESTIKGIYRAKETLKATVKKEPVVAGKIAGVPISRIKKIGEEVFGKDEKIMESFILMLRTDESLDALSKDSSLLPEERNRRVEGYIREGAETLKKRGK